MTTEVEKREEESVAPWICIAAVSFGGMSLFGSVAAAIVCLLVAAAVFVLIAAVGHAMEGPQGLHVPAWERERARIASEAARAERRSDLHVQSDCAA